jgi:hypothetical protein
MGFSKEVWNTALSKSEADSLATEALKKWEYYINTSIEKATLFRANMNYKGFNLSLSLAYTSSSGGVARNSDDIYRLKYITLDNLWISRWNAKYGADTWRNYTDTALEQEIYNELGLSPDYIEQLKADQAAQIKSQIAFQEAQAAQKKRDEEAAAQLLVTEQLKRDEEAKERARAASESAKIKEVLTASGISEKDTSVNVFEIIKANSSEISQNAQQIYETKKALSDATGIPVNEIPIEIVKNELVTSDKVNIALSNANTQAKTQNSVISSLFDFNSYMDTQIQKSDLFEQPKTETTSFSSVNILIALGILAAVVAMKY